MILLRYDGFGARDGTARDLVTVNEEGMSFGSCICVCFSTAAGEVLVLLCVTGNNKHERRVERRVCRVTSSNTLVCPEQRREDVLIVSFFLS